MLLKAVAVNRQTEEKESVPELSVSALSGCRVVSEGFQNIEKGNVDGGQSGPDHTLIRHTPFGSGRVCYSAYVLFLPFLAHPKVLLGPGSSWSSTFSSGCSLFLQKKLCICLCVCRQRVAKLKSRHKRKRQSSRQMLEHLVCIGSSKKCSQLIYSLTDKHSHFHVDNWILLNLNICINAVTS